MRIHFYYLWLRRSLRDLSIVIFVYVLIAYLILPAVWRHYEHNPALESAPKTTESFAGFPGDPLNVALVGTRDELTRGMLIAGWLPADSVTLKTSLSIATSIVLGRSYPTAPISTLYLWNRKQDLAFEKADGSARRRHHVRFWLSPLTEQDGRPLWIGAATFDQGVGFNHFTGQLTHHIASDVDTERDALFHDLSVRRQLVKLYQVTGVGANIAGRNAGGDWYYTDGELTVGILSPKNALSPASPVVLENPPTVDWKNKGWAYLRTLLAPTPSPLSREGNPAKDLQGKATGSTVTGSRAYTIRRVPSA